MKSYHHTPRFIYCFFAFLSLVLAPLISSAQPDGKNDAPGPSDRNDTSERFVSIDFNNVDINVFIKFISELTSTNFVVDQRVKGKVTIISPARISVDEAFKVFESVLEVHGYTTVKAGKVIKIVPSTAARSKNVKTLLKEAAGLPNDRVVTQLIPLRYAAPVEIKKLFTPLVSKSSVILAYAPTNTLIITDIHTNITRLLRILKTIDVAGIGREISVIPLLYADAAKFVTMLKLVFKAAKKPKPGDVSSIVEFVADDRTNTIVLLASEDDTTRIKSLIAMLDKQVPRGDEKIRVYRLENATAEDLAKVLQTLSARSAGTAKGGKRSAVVSDNVKITADKATNSLIIMADKDDYVVLEDIIRKLDIPRAMVYIEALIMEVNVDKTFSIGTEWQALGEAAYNKKEGVVGGGFSPTGGFNPTSLLTTPGFALGVIGGAVTITTQNPIGPGTVNLTLPNIGAIINAFKSDKDVHILSTPQILTTDNEEAKITVGKNVPYQTRSTQVSGISDVYSSFEYKDVGKTLKITPQISKDRMVRLSIFLEVTALAGNPEDTNFRPTTLKRTIDTTVIVKDGHTVVIGGLIDDTFTNSVIAVPCLGGIPGFGWLFKSASRSDTKTNLYVFLTPHVLGNPSESTVIYKEKKAEIDQIKEGSIKIYEKSGETSD